MTTLGSKLGVLSLALVAGAGCAHGGVRGEPVCAGRAADAPSGIQVVGRGKAEAVPDVAVLQVGVEVHAPAVDTAREAAANAQQAVLEALRGAGVDDKDIQTNRLSIAPDYSYGEEGRKLLGYVVTNQVEVRMHALDRVGEAIDAATRAGGDAVRLDGIRFELSDPDALLAQARAEAVADAKAKAAQLADQLGVRLGEPLGVEEMATEQPTPVTMRMESAGPRTPTPVAPGTTEVHAEVRVRFAIGG